MTCCEPERMKTKTNENYWFEISLKYTDLYNLRNYFNMCIYLFVFIIEVLSFPKCICIELYSPLK